MHRIYFGAMLTAIAIAFGTQQTQAQPQQTSQVITSLSHNIGNPVAPTSPFFTQATGDDGTVFDFAAAGGLAGDIVSGASDTTNVSGTFTFVGNSNAITNFTNGNRLPNGITISFDLSFSISTGDGVLVTDSGNTGNGLGPGALPFGSFDPGEAIEFSAATISNVSVTGTPTDPGATFALTEMPRIGLSQFRSNNFAEVSGGAILDNGTDSVGFGISEGSLASGISMNNGFANAAARFPVLSMATPLTLTMDPASTGVFNLKGLEFTTTFGFDVTSPFDGVSVALTNFSHNIGNPVAPVSPFFTQGTGDDGTVFDYTAANGLVGSIVAGASDTTAVSGTVTIVGNATAANDFSNGNQVPQGITLSYDLSFTISSPDGPLTVAFLNTGDGIGIGPAQNETINDGEQLVFSPAIISNVAFSGAPVDDINFVPGDVVDVALDAFRTNNFIEAESGAVLSNGTDSVGFGLATGTLASNVDIDNGFAAADRFPPISMLDQLTLTANAGGSTFNLKGFEIATVFTFETDDGDFLLGDVNQDGFVNFLDISPFISRLSGGEFLDEADIDRNGIVNFADISPFITLLSSQ